MSQVTKLSKVYSYGSPQFLVRKEATLYTYRNSKRHYQNKVTCNLSPPDFQVPEIDLNVRSKLVETVLKSEEILESSVGNLKQSFPELEFPTGVMEQAVDGMKTFDRLPFEEQLKFIALFVGFWVYLTVRPGVLAGAIDAYVLAPIQNVLYVVKGRKAYKRTDFVIGRRLGEGSFGTVFEGAIVPEGIAEESLGRRSKSLEEYDNSKKLKRVVLKKVKMGVYGAEQCGEVEEWFNLRMQRVAPEACAKYLGSFVADKTRGQFTQGGKWLVWSFEGDCTLNDFMLDRDFPLNLADAIYGSALKNVDLTRRKAIVIRKILGKILVSLQKIHATGIVHRDIKPSNIIITNEGDIKLIDFGAATDLRVGKNYIPNMGMLDPDFCPPEQYVMPDTTPKPPPEPLAALLSPFLWIVNHPDLFDMYSVGIVFLQMACPQLRTPLGFKTFKAELKDLDYDLKLWRKATRVNTDFEILDVDGGRGFDLACKLIAKRGTVFKGRLSAAEALRHPYFLLSGDQATVVLSKLSGGR